MDDNASNTPKYYTMGIVDFLKLLVLLYAALVPAGLWVRGEIKSSIRDAIENGVVVSTPALNAREYTLRNEFMTQLANGMGPVISRIAFLEDQMRYLEDQPPAQSSRPRRSKPIKPDPEPPKQKQYIWQQPDQQPFSKPDGGQ